MIKRFLAGGVLLLLLALPVPTAAETARALVIGNERHPGATPIRLGGAVRAASAALAGAGFHVLTAADLEAEALRERLAMLLEPPAPERVVILLAGHFAHAGGQSWFLGTDARRPGLATADGMGLPLATVLAVAARSPGGAVVLLGSETRRTALGEGLAPGLGPLDPPQGVTVITGDLGPLIDFAETGLAREGESLPALLEGFPQLAAQGFLSPLVPFVPAGLAPGFEESVDDTEAAADLAAWEEARARDSIEAYEAYLARFPQGRFAAAAREGIERIATDPERIEAALSLTAAQRREIQRQLTYLGFNTRGIDGIFGPGTRGAIRGWQAGRGLPDSGFLTAAQLALLAQDVALREAELVEQERREREAAEAADRAFWRDTGAGRDEAGLRAYLGRYPNGLFADVARARLAELEAGRDRAAWDAARATDTPEAYRRYLRDWPNGQFVTPARTRLNDLEAAADQAAWNRARAADTAAAYRAYLTEYPEGRHAAEARARLAALEPPPPAPPAPSLPLAPDAGAEAQAQGRAEEAALGLNFVARSMIVAQLGFLGYNPGRVDGSFDGRTRQAIAAFQRDRDVPATGYVTRETLRLLIAEGLPMATFD